MEELGNRIRLVRSGLGLNQGEFAKRLGLGGAALISKYELGHLEPGIETLINISQLGGESLDWLVMGGAIRGKAPDKKLQKLLLKVESIYHEGKPAKINALKILLDGLLI
ncbi:MAG: helix-turn-helix transcriptional regulator [Nitrospinae bacterium]|nr:helix-turn-helix transcriptional regulator [Nitrospinota bacterium]